MCVVGTLLLASHETQVKTSQAVKADKAGRKMHDSSVSGKKAVKTLEDDDQGKSEQGRNAGVMGLVGWQVIKKTSVQGEYVLRAEISKVPRAPTGGERRAAASAGWYFCCFFFFFSRLLLVDSSSTMTTIALLLSTYEWGGGGGGVQQH